MTWPVSKRLECLIFMFGVLYKITFCTSSCVYVCFVFKMQQNAKIRVVYNGSHGNGNKNCTNYKGVQHGNFGSCYRSAGLFRLLTQLLNALSGYNSSANLRHLPFLCFLLNYHLIGFIQGDIRSWIFAYLSEVNDL